MNDLRKSISLDSTNADSYLGLGMMYKKFNNKNKAIQYLKKAAKLGSTKSLEILKEYSVDNKH